jgi:hypothetical protein
MNDPLAGLGARWPEKSQVLGQVFNDTAASYKFYWLLGLLRLIEHTTTATFSETEIVEEMVVAAWHPVCFYRLSLGMQDKLQKAVLQLRDKALMANDSKPEEIRPHLMQSESSRARVRDLTNLVPTRFLSPWFSSELRGVDGHVRTQRIKELARQSQSTSSPTPYFFDREGSTAVIRVNDSWRKFFRENCEVIRSFVFFHLCQYLQARNPNVPGIVNKLTVPTQRDLATARRFWRSVRSEFQQGGKGHLFSDIYAGTVLEREFSIDHFLPWSFVAHDLLWNLTPVSHVTNSRKGDALPKLNIFLPKLSSLHREAVLVLRDKPRLLEDYANWFNSDIAGIAVLSAEGFLQHYRESFEPQLQIASNQGFQIDWSA